MRTLFLTVALILAMVCVACATQVELIWNMSDPTGVTGYKIYRGRATGVYDQPVVAVGTTGCLPTTPVECHHIYDVPNGLWYWVVTATSGTDESGYSNEVSKKLIGKPETLRTGGK